MKCANNLIPLPCNIPGVGYTRTTFDNTDTEIPLMSGHGLNFPAVASGKWYYVKVYDACSGCCGEYRVTGRTANSLTVEPVSPLGCACMTSNAKVTFVDVPVYIVEDIVKSVGINVVAPLVYDCTTNTLSLDCTAWNGCEVCP